MLMLTAASVSSVMILNELNKSRRALPMCIFYYGTEVGATVKPAAGMTVYSTRCVTKNPSIHNIWVINQVENSGTYMICVDGTDLCYGHTKKEDMTKYDYSTPWFINTFNGAGKLFIKDPTSPYQRWTNSTAQPKRFMNVGTQLCDRVFSSGSGVTFPLETEPCKKNEQNPVYEKSRQWNFVDTVQ